MKNIKIISLLSCVAVFLLTIAIVTVNQTFSMDDDENNFSIKLSTDNENTIIKGTNVNFYNTVSLGDTYSFDITVENVGNIDAEIRKVIKSNLSDYEVATSKETNKTYTLADYLTYSIYYDEDNVDNDIFVTDKVQAFDHLKVNTSNKMKVVIKFDKTNVTEDEANALKETNGDTLIKFNLYLNLDYTNM